MKETNILEELDALHAKKIQEIEKIVEAVVKKLTKQHTMNLSAIRQAISELRTSLVAAKSLLKAAKDTQNRLLSIRGASKRF